MPFSQREAILKVWNDDFTSSSFSDDGGEQAPPSPPSRGVTTHQEA